MCGAHAGEHEAGAGSEHVSTGSEHDELHVGRVLVRQDRVCD